MPHKHASALEVMSKAENYNAWVYNKIKPFIGKSILEVGSGIGNFTKFLSTTEELVCLDLSKKCIEKTRSKFHNQSNIIHIEGDIASDRIIDKINIANFDTIICLNVLEHIKQDLKALENINKLLKCKGHLILMVPAVKSIFGDIDRSVGHERRYNKSELKNKLEISGFKNISLNYLNSLGIIGWFFNNMILHKKELSLSQTIFYDRLVIPILSRIEAFIPPPFGMSLIVIAEK